LKALGAHSCLVTFGAMSRKPVTVGNGDLIFKLKKAIGFHLKFWIKKVGVSKARKAMERLVDMVVKKELVQKVGDVFPLTEFKKAVAKANESGKNGKVLFDCSPALA